MKRRPSPGKTVGGAGPGVVMLVAGVDEPLGGTAKQAIGLAGALRSRGLSLWVVGKRLRGSKETGIRELHDAHVRCVRLPIVQRQPAWSFLLSFLVWAVIHRRSFQVIHAHNVSLGVIGSLVSCLVPKKVILKIRATVAVDEVSGRSLFQKLRRWIVLKKTSCFVAVSREIEALLRDVGVPPQKIAVIPNGVAATPANDNGGGEVRKAKIVGGRPLPVVLYVGRLAEEKGMDELLALWAAVRQRREAVLLIVGDGPLRGALEARARALGIASSVRFLGHHADVSRFYGMADLFVLPSRTEGLSNALLEAMAAGVPVVASDVGGNRDVLEDTQSGMLVDWTDIEGCAEALCALLADPDGRRRMGQAGRRRAMAFAMETVAERYHRLYDAVLQQDGRGDGLQSLRVGAKEEVSR